MTAPGISTSDFLHHVGFAYAQFLQQVGMDLLRTGDPGGYGAVMLQILKQKGLDPFGLTGVDITQETLATYGILIERDEATGYLRFFPPEMVRKIVGLDPTATTQELVTAVMSALVPAGESGGLLKRLFAKPRPNPKHLYCFTIFALQSETRVPTEPEG